MMKKIKASKSASDIGLRGAATGSVSSSSAFPTLRRKKSFTPSVKKAKGKGSAAVDKKGPTGPKKVKSTRDQKKVDSNVEDAVVVDSTSSPKKVKSERTNAPAQSSAPSKPKALPGPSKPSSKPKKSGGPRAPRDKTRTVFVAEPKVSLDEGPDFGKVTHDITKTKQPVNPRQFR